MKKNQRTLQRAAICTLMLVAATQAVADVVTLTNGSKLVGTFERIEGGKLKLVTEFAGTLEIDAAMIESMQTEGKVNIKLDSGDRLVGPVAAQGAEGSTVQTAVGNIGVDIATADAVWPEGAMSPEDIAAQQEIDKRVGKWSFTAEAGATNRDGNTESLDAMGALTLQRKSSESLLKFYLTGQYGEQNKVRNTAEVIGGILYEHNISDDFYWFVRNEAEYDEFESLDLRYTLTTGPGYYWIHKPDHELKTFAGLGYLHESYRTPPGGARDAAQAEVGLSYLVDITEWLRFAHATTWYPTFEELRDYRLVSDTYVMMPLGTSDQWKFKVGAMYEYDPIPQAGRERLDETYYANIVFELKEK